MIEIHTVTYMHNNEPVKVIEVNLEVEDEGKLELFRQSLTTQKHQINLFFTNKNKTYEPESEI